MEKWPLGVFASIDAGLGVKLEVAYELGVPTMHLHTPQPASRTPERAREFRRKLDGLGMRVTVVFGGFEGESYADIPTVARTVGLVPPATRAQRTRELKEIADFAQGVGAEAIGLHLGLIPENTADPDFRAVRDATREVCDHCRSLGLRFHLETGQETAEGLLCFLHETDRDNLFINFDPANMILYGSGEPIAALEKVGPYVRSIHCKDGKWAARPGIDWGAEVPLGEGDVGFERFLCTLDRFGYAGPLTIEREIPQDPERQKEEIGRGIRLLEGLKQKLTAAK